MPRFENFVFSPLFWPICWPNKKGQNGQILFFPRFTSFSTKGHMPRLSNFFKKWDFSFFWFLASYNKIKNDFFWKIKTPSPRYFPEVPEKAQENLFLTNRRARSATRLCKKKNGTDIYTHTFWGSSEVEKIIPQNTLFLKKCCAKYRLHCLPKNFFRKIQYIRKIVPQNTESQNEYFANYSFLNVVLRILQFSQNTENNELCYAKYRIKCYAKYNFFNRMLHKIQDILLRKIQINVKIVPQNTGKKGCV